jgi:hypothetical protein
MHRSVLATFAVAFLSQPAAAAVPVDQIPQEARSSLRSGTFVEVFISQLPQPLRKLDVNRDGLDAPDIDRARQELQRRARAFGLVTIFGFDQNGDGSVTPDEIRTSLQQKGIDGGSPDDTAGIERLVVQLMQADSDNDGRVTAAEALAFVPPGTSDDSQIKSAVAYLALDPNKDGKLTGDELASLGREWFAAVDVNGDSYIDRTEAQAVRPEREAFAGIATADCVLPPPAAADGIVVFGIRHGLAFSTAAIAGLDNETGTVGVTIDPGSDPIYLVLSSGEPTIWRIEGARERVSRVVLVGSSSSGGGAAVGVTGIDRAKVSFAPRGCRIALYDGDSARVAATKAMLARALGRTDGVVVKGVYGAVAVRLPSGDTGRPAVDETPPAGFDADLWKEALKSRPGGLVSIDLATVVADHPAVAFEVLPGMAGVAQLLGSGALTRLGANSFKIAKAIPRYPPGFGSVQFVLGKGVPRPAGKQAAYCVISEETGLPLMDSVLCSPR